MVKKQHKKNDLKPKATRKGALSEELIAKALRANKGIINRSAQSLGITRTPLWQRIQNSPFLQAVQEECFESRIDDAEASLSALVDESHMQAIDRLLKHKRAVARGYGEQNAIDVKDLAKFKEMGDFLGWSKKDE